MEFLAGLDADGMDQADKLHSQLVRGLLTDEAFALALHDVRMLYTVPGLTWIDNGDGVAMLVKVYVTDVTYSRMPTLTEEEEANVQAIIDATEGVAIEMDFGFRESDFTPCPGCGQYH